jgi:hypothetical protein
VTLWSRCVNLRPHSSSSALMACAGQEAASELKSSKFHPQRSGFVRIILEPPPHAHQGMRREVGQWDMTTKSHAQ